VRAGEGKKALANLIAGSEVFPAASSQSNMYEATCESQCGNYRYTFKLFQTEGNSSDVLRNYFREKKTDSFNLLLFVIRKGENHDQDVATTIANLDAKVGDYSALVVTGCEDMQQFERETFLDGFRRDSTFRFFNTKRMFAVGFPGDSSQQELGDEGLHKLIKNSKQQLSAGDAFFAPSGPFGVYFVFQSIYDCLLETCSCTIL